MTRKELYAEVKNFNLQDEIKAMFGKNFTQVSNADLEKVILDVAKCSSCESNFVDEDGNEYTIDEMVANTHNSLVDLVELLQKKRILLKSEVDAILG